ncbi:protein-tyrosine phosphatase [Ochromonadaceae sp. CCMP2298]|nr:protein-tyrosine phosphatase [Ochromonadaceae sp. CCMP2298]|mmetsp:Transcript_3743/g.8066  ORF Transcript_3743/g.8066 Transcript_3743/m.8066 type:complete len:193 (-) Transcript_3743:11-589(-)
MASQEEDVEFIAPENFSMVEPGVYRSAFPRTKNIEFLRQLKLRSVVSLVPEDYPTAMADFYKSAGIRLLSHGLDGNKWPFKEIDQEMLQRCLQDVLLPANRPLLIHCNKGKHRTGSVVGSLRKIRGWALSSIFTEYLLFAAPKSRLEDQLLIEDFQFDWRRAEREREEAQIEAHSDVEGQGGLGMDSEELGR